MGLALIFNHHELIGAVLRRVSPQGVFLVVILRTLVGILTGPFTFSSLSLAPLIRSWQTFSRDFTFLEVRVILILWTGASSSTPFPSLKIRQLYSHDIKTMLRHQFLNIGIVKVSIQC